MEFQIEKEKKKKLTEKVAKWPFFYHFVHLIRFARAETRACVRIGARLSQTCHIHFLLSNAHSLDLLGPLQMSTDDFLPIFLLFKICPTVNSCLQ